MRYKLIIFIIFLTTPLGAQDDDLQVSINKTTPYLGESISYTIQFTSTRELTNTQIDLPEFVGFAQEPSSASLSQVTENGTLTNIVTQTVNLYSNQVGELIIPPTRVIIPDTPFAEGIQVDSNTIAVNVLPLPPDAPDTFSGAVGQFDISTIIELPVIQAGNPNTLKISIMGAGNFEQFTSPIPEFPATWEIFERPTTYYNSSASLQSIIFEYQFFSNQTGSNTIPATRFTFFDPISQSYKTIYSNPLTFIVEGEFTAQNQLSQSPLPNNQLPLKLMQSDPASIIPASTFWLLWIIAPIIAFIIFLMRFASQFNMSANPKISKSQLQNQALAQLTQARKQPPTLAYQIVEQTILQYLSQKYNQDINTQSQLDNILTYLPIELQKQVLACIEQAQSGQYAPVSQNDTEQLLRRTYKTIQQIEERS